MVRVAAVVVIVRAMAAVAIVEQQSIFFEGFGYDCVCVSGSDEGLGGFIRYLA